MNFSSQQTTVLLKRGSVPFLQEQVMKARKTPCSKVVGHNSRFWWGGQHGDNFPVCAVWGYRPERCWNCCIFSRKCFAKTFVHKHSNVCVCVWYSSGVFFRCIDNCSYITIGKEICNSSTQDSAALSVEEWDHHPQNILSTARTRSWWGMSHDLWEAHNILF